MEIYKHRQVGTVILVGLGLGAVLSTWILADIVGEPIWASLPLLVFFLVAILFWSLTVEVSEECLVVAFGIGVIRRSFRCEDIIDAQIVKNRWYYGWGMRLTPYGWMFNVSGLDAVELELADQKKFRIGTDDPQQLLSAIRQAAGLT
jgi:hypothetical protein